MPFSVREGGIKLNLIGWLAGWLTIAGINIFLAGFIPTENLRFRDYALTFKVCASVWLFTAISRHY